MTAVGLAAGTLAEVEGGPHLVARVGVDVKIPTGGDGLLMGLLNQCGEGIGRRHHNSFQASSSDETI